MKKRFFITLFSFLVLSLTLHAQPRLQLVQVIVTPDHADWTYVTGERASFSITVLRNNVPLKGIAIKYVIQPELVDIWEEGSMILEDEAVSVTAKKFTEPGFLRCTATVTVDGKEYTSYVTTFHHTKNKGHMTYISWLNDFN